MAVGLHVLMSFSTGVQLALGDPQEGFGLIGFSTHWFWQLIFSVGAAGIAGGIAGLIARRWGGPIGGVAALPLTGASVFVLILEALSRTEADGAAIDFDIATSSLIVSGLLTIAQPLVAWICGRRTVKIAQEFTGLFDGRRGTWLGVSWYNMLWLYLMSTYWLTALAETLVYLEKPIWMIEKMSWSSSQGILHELAMLIYAVYIAILLGALKISFDGIKRAYQWLSGLAPWPGAARVFAHGVLLPTFVRVMVALGRYLAYTLLSGSASS